MAWIDVIWNTLGKGLMGFVVGFAGSIVASGLTAYNWETSLTLAAYVGTYGFIEAVYETLKAEKATAGVTKDVSSYLFFGK